MKMHLLLRSLLMVCAASFAALDTSADPILPYQQPIADHLDGDISGGFGDARTLNHALSTFHRRSRSLAADIGILRDLNRLLASEPNYPALITNAVGGYLGDFEDRRAALKEQLRPAPRSAAKTSAQKLLERASDAFASVESHTNTTTRDIAQLLTAATKIQQASNVIQRALHTRVGLSSVGARIGALRFNSTRGFITGGANFVSETGTAFGEFNGSNGVLTVSAIDNGGIVRGIHLHVEGIGTNTPATYPLGVDQNSAFYDATDQARKREYHFQCDPALTNSIVTNAYMTIDFIGTNYLLGTFAFNGTNIALPNNRLICVTNLVDGTNMVTCRLADTNTTVTVSRGDFQLDFSH
jgi:hypothetical protein